jgi:hypothetical protein
MMLHVDEIIDMARLFEPHTKEPPKFQLVFEGGSWRTEVRLGKYYLDASGPTADEAIADLHRQMVEHTKRISSWAGRMLVRLKSPLKVVT